MNYQVDNQKDFKKNLNRNSKLTLPLFQNNMIPIKNNVMSKMTLGIEVYLSDSDGILILYHYDHRTTELYLGYLFILLCASQCCKTQLYWTLKSFKFSILSVTECNCWTGGVWGGVVGCSLRTQPNTVTFLGRERDVPSTTQLTLRGTVFHSVFFLQQSSNHMNTSEPYDFFVEYHFADVKNKILWNNLPPEFMQILTKRYR